MVSPAEYFRGLNMWFNPFYITYAMVKTLCFGFIISSISAYFGYFTSGGALEVGKSSTNAVVYCCIVILLVNFIITQLMIA
jgi:phospholipid/cholesterol/gamma-HCH transport system permease protein